MMEGFHSARVGLLDSSVLPASPFPLLLRLCFKGTLVKDIFVFNLSLKNSQFKKKKLICFSVWGLYPLMEFDLHKLFSPGPAQIPDAAGRELIAQPPCGADSLLLNYAPHGGLGGLLEWSSHAWIPLPIHPHPCGCLLSPACARLSCCPLPQSPCGMQGRFLNSLCATQIHLKARNAHPCLMTGFALLLQPQ